MSSTTVPAGRIRRQDSILLPVDPGRVFGILLDLHSYGNWWPRSVRFELTCRGPVRAGTRMRISNQRLVRWVAEVTAIEPNRHIAFRYIGGAWDGTAEWILEPEAGGVRVIYRVDIVAIPLWIRAIGRFVDLGALHSRQMREALENLGARVLSSG